MAPFIITVGKIFSIGNLTYIIYFFDPKWLFSMNYSKQNILDYFVFSLFDKGGFTF